MTDLQQQIEVLQSYVDRNPDDVRALVRLGALKFVDTPHDVQEVTDLLQKAVNMDPGNVDARFWLAKCLYHDHGSAELAIPVLEEALLIDPHRADCLDLLASAMGWVGKNAKDYISYLERAVRAAPDWVSVHQNLAVALVELGRISEAKRELRLALEFLNTAPVTADPVEEYYEWAVTGRSETDESILLHLQGWATLKGIQQFFVSLFRLQCLGLRRIQRFIVKKRDLRRGRRL